MSSAPPILDLNAYHATHGAELAEFLHLAFDGRDLSFEERSALTRKAKSELLAGVRDVLQRQGAPARAVTVLCDDAEKGFDRRLAELATSATGGSA